MSGRAAARLAWSLWAAYAGLAIATFLLVAFRQGRPEALIVVALVGFATIGALIASRQPRNPIGWILSVIGLSFAFSSFADAYVGSSANPALELVGWTETWSWHVWLTLAAIFLPLLFPTGRLLSRRWRPVVWLGLCALALSIVGAAFKPGELDLDPASPIENPLGVDGVAEDVVAVAATIGNVLAGVGFVLAAASLALRFRRSHGEERQQLKWFAYVGVLALAALATAMAGVLLGVEGDDPDVAPWVEAMAVAGWFAALFLIVVGIPVATGVAILRHRLFDIDVVINRTLVYGALTATLALAYLGSVLLLGLALRPLTASSNLAIAGSTLAVAALFRPARSRIQELVDHRFYRRKYDAALTLERFGARLRDEIELDALSEELRGVVRETMQPSHVSLWLRTPEGTR